MSNKNDNSHEINLINSTQHFLDYKDGNCPSPEIRHSIIEKLSNKLTMFLFYKFSRLIFWVFLYVRKSLLLFIKVFVSWNNARWKLINNGEKNSIWLVVISFQFLIIDTYKCIQDFFSHWIKTLSKTNFNI